MGQRIFFILLASVLCASCYAYPVQSIDNYSDTLIHIGNITVSNPFFKRDIRNYIASTRSDKTDSSALAIWYHRYLDDLLLTNCAIDKGILKRADVEESAIGFENYVLIQKGSSFYQANINSKIKVSSDELNEAYQKMAAIISFSLIRFSSKATYLSTLKGKEISNYVFEDLKHVHNDSIEYFNNQLIWPSLQFWHLQRQIAFLKTGEISKPVTSRNDEFSDAIYVIRVDSARSITKKTFELEKPRLEMTLGQIKEDSLYNRYERSILQKADIQLDTKNLSDSLVKCIVTHWIDPKDIYFLPYLRMPLMKYFMNGTPLIVRCHDLLRYYRNLPIRPSIQSRNDVINQLYYYVLSSYMVHDASLANFDKEPKFVSLKKDLRHKFGLQKFKEELFNTISVTKDESLAYYHKHMHDFMVKQKTYEESKDQICSKIKEQKFIEVKENLLKQAQRKYSFYLVPSFKSVLDIYNSIH